VTSWLAPHGCEKSARGSAPSTIPPNNLSRNVSLPSYRSLGAVAAEFDSGFFNRVQVVCPRRHRGRDVFWARAAGDRGHEGFGAAVGRGGEQFERAAAGGLRASASSR
jgi:hypothetical protein